MPLKEVQKDVEDWVSQYKIGYFEPHQILARLIEEVGELAREINHLYGPKKKKSSEETKEMSDEMADIIFTLCCLANSKGIDLGESWQRMMQKLRTRDDTRFEKK
jgi:NTP pyrophosphatase (non-canonical NTP hydrolase)